jgi:hypothetical protein
MKYIISFLIAVVILFLYSYFFFFDKMPESIQIHGYINYMTKAPSAFFGGFIGIFAASFFSFTPAVMKFPGYILSLKDRFKLSSDPIKSTGKIISKKVNHNNTNLVIQYSVHQKEFSVDNRVLTNSLSIGDEVTVFYDPNNPQLAYIDFHLESEELALNIKESKTIFKLLDITPRFDLSPNSFELTGELYGEKYNKQKSSFIHSFQSNDIEDLVPGKLLPCLITKTEDSFSIQLSINQ